MLVHLNSSGSNGEKGHFLTFDARSCLIPISKDRSPFSILERRRLAGDDVPGSGGGVDRHDGVVKAVAAQFSMRLDTRV